MTTDDTLDALTERYCEAAVALNRYRRAHGFNPGVRVVAKYGDASALGGSIAPYGKYWGYSNHMCVPVLLDNGVMQPWDMRHLTIEVDAGRPL